MDKKVILSSAAKELKAKGPESFGGWAGRQWSAFCKWAKRTDKLVFFNIALLFIVCVLFAAMYGRVRGDRRAAATGYTLTERVQVYDLAERLARRDRPTIVIARRADNAPKIRKSAAPAPKAVTLPIRQRAVDMMPASKKTVQGNIVIDGNGRNIKMPPMVTVNGSLYIQNLRTWTLPCGTRINGHLHLRNVQLLKFCGCFDVKGNIYVSSNSSFGPLPKDAFLGGQVIF